MKVEVHYQTGEPGPAFEHVANINVPESITDVDKALEYVFGLTQNIEGSWSRPSIADDAPNPDWSPNVELVKPIRVFQGQHLGHRSSMVGDHFVIDGRTYVATSVGFVG